MMSKPLFRVLTPDGPGVSKSLQSAAAGATPGDESAMALPSGSISIWFNDEALNVPGDRSVAAALLAAGVRRFRATPVSGAARGPYCMMGACFECLVEIDGMPSRQSCLIAVQDGMRIRSQEGASDLPHGLDSAAKPTAVATAAAAGVTSAEKEMRHGQ